MTDSISAYWGYIVAAFPLVYGLVLLASHVVKPGTKLAGAVNWFLGGARAIAAKEGIQLPPDPRPAAKAPTVTPLSRGLSQVWVLIGIAIGAILMLAAVPACARGDDAPADSRLPSTLCAIGAQGKWCYGFLPTLTLGFGIDVRHGEVVPNVGVGTSLAATWSPGQLKSITIGAHSGFNGGSNGAPATFNLGGTISALKGFATVIVDWQAVGGNHAVVIAPALGAAF